MKHISYELFNNYFYYDESSPSCLRWKVDRVCGNGVKKRSAGEVAGYLCKTSGYYKVTLNCGDFMVHRVVYCLVNEGIPDDLGIDHKDGLKHNNKIENLRCVPQRANTQNTKFRKDNTSGVKGVHLKTKVTKTLNVFEYWLATWMDQDGKVREKAFSVLKYGHEKAKQLAIEFRESIILELNAKGESYTTRHQNFITK